MGAKVYNVYRYPPADAIYIGRPGKGVDGYWGNPCSIGKSCPECYQIHKDGGSTLPCYEAYLRRRLSIDTSFRMRFFGLKGQNLKCFCAKSEPLTLEDNHICHGQIMLKVLAE